MISRNKFYTNTKLWPQWFWWQKFIHKKFIQFFIHNNWIFMLLPDLFKFLLLYKNHNHSLKDNDRSLWKSLQLNFTGWLLLTAARFTSLSWNFVGLRGGQYPKIMVEPKQLWSDIYYFAFWNRGAQNFAPPCSQGIFQCCICLWKSSNNRKFSSQVYSFAIYDNFYSFPFFGSHILK